MISRGRSLVTVLRATSAALGVLIVWQAYVQVTGIRSYILPAPTSILSRLWLQWPLLLEHLRVTLTETLVGLGIGSAIGVTIAVLVVHWAVLQETLYPLVVSLQAVPKVALAPLLVAWFGLGIESKVVLTILICFFPVVVAGITGLGQVDQELLDLARSQGANRWKVLYLIRAPHALPYLADSLKVALPLAMIGAITGEFVSGQSGIGTLLLDSSARLQTDLTFAALLVIAVTTATLYGGLMLAERILLRWHRLEIGAT